MKKSMSVFLFLFLNTFTLTAFAGQTKKPCYKQEYKADGQIKEFKYGTGWSSDFSACLDELVTGNDTEGKPVVLTKSQSESIGCPRYGGLSPEKQQEALKGVIKTWSKVETNYRQNHNTTKKGDPEIPSGLVGLPALPELESECQYTAKSPYQSLRCANELLNQNIKAKRDLSSSLPFMQYEAGKKRFREEVRMNLPASCWNEPYNPGSGSSGSNGTTANGNQ